MRITPVGPPQAYKTYQVAVPLQTHWRAATCAEVECENYINGWRIRVESLALEDLHLAKTSGRRYQVAEVAAGETWLVFEAGQPCFASATHKARLERPELFVVRGGDWRGNPTGRKPDLLQPAAWLDDFGENQEAIVEEIERG
jgi:hypothetical protein